MTQQRGTMAAAEVNVGLSVQIPNAATFGAVDVERVT
jgi:hypothetical protein